MPITLKGYESKELGVLGTKAFLDSYIDRGQPIFWLSLYNYAGDIDFETFRGFYRDDNSVQSTTVNMNPDARGVSNQTWFIANNTQLGVRPNEFLDFNTSIVKRYPIRREDITFENDNGVVVMNISITAELDEDLAFRYLTIIGDTEDAYGKYKLEGLPRVNALTNGARITRDRNTYYMDFKGNFYQADYQAMGEEALVDLFCPRQLVTNPNNPFGVSPGNFQTKTTGHFNYEGFVETMPYMDETGPLTISNTSRPIIRTTLHSNPKPFYMPYIYSRVSGNGWRFRKRYQGNTADREVVYSVNNTSFGIAYTYNVMYFSSTYPAVSNLTNETIDFANLDGLFSIADTLEETFSATNTYPGGVALPTKYIYPLSGITYYIEKLEQDTALVAGDSFSATIRIELTSI